MSRNNQPHNSNAGLPRQRTLNYKTNNSDLLQLQAHSMTANNNYDPHANLQFVNNNSISPRTAIQNNHDIRVQFGGQQQHYIQQHHSRTPMSQNITHNQEHMIQAYVTPQPKPLLVANVNSNNYNSGNASSLLSSQNPNKFKINNANKQANNSVIQNSTQNNNGQQNPMQNYTFVQSSNSFIQNQNPYQKPSNLTQQIQLQNSKNLKKALYEVYERNNQTNSNQLSQPKTSNKQIADSGLPTEQFQNSAVIGVVKNLLVNPQQIAIRNQKRSQSVERNAPSSHQYMALRAMNKLQGPTPQNLNFNNPTGLSFNMDQQQLPSFGGSQTQHIQSALKSKKKSLNYDNLYNSHQTSRTINQGLKNQQQQQWSNNTSQQIHDAAALDQINNNMLMGQQQHDQAKNHFINEAIERRIEKFSRQNTGERKRAKLQSHDHFSIGSAANHNKTPSLNKTHQFDKGQLLESTMKNDGLSSSGLMIDDQSMLNIAQLIQSPKHFQQIQNQSLNDQNKKYLKQFIEQKNKGKTNIFDTAEQQLLDQVQIPDIQVILEKYQNQIKNIGSNNNSMISVGTHLKGVKKNYQPLDLSKTQEIFQNLNANQHSKTPDRSTKNVKLDKLDNQPQIQFLQGQGQQKHDNYMHSPQTNKKKKFLQQSIVDVDSRDLQQYSQVNQNENKKESGDDHEYFEDQSPSNINSQEQRNLKEMALMLMSVSDEQFINKNQDCSSSRGDENQSASSSHNLQKISKNDMLKMLNRVLDRNKPLFLFNSKHNVVDSIGDTGTPSFSMIALIEKN
eukprot:403356252